MSKNAMPTGEPPAELDIVSKHRKRVRQLTVATPKAKYIFCTCGASSLKLGKAVRGIYPFVRGECPFCGEFGYYPRVWNGKFDTEATGQNRRDHPLT